MISEACEDENRKKVLDNFKEVNGNNGNLSHQGVWKLKKKMFSENPTYPTSRKEELKETINNKSRRAEKFVFRYL